MSHEEGHVSRVSGPDSAPDIKIKKEIGGPDPEERTKYLTFRLQEKHSCR